MHLPRIVPGHVKGWSQVRTDYLEELLAEVKAYRGGTMNRIVQVSLTLLSDKRWRVDVRKEFAPENGGGEQIFTEFAPHVHLALDVARGMVTMSPAQRTFTEADQMCVDCDGTKTDLCSSPQDCPKKTSKQKEQAHGRD